MLVSGVQQSDSMLYIFVCVYVSPLYKIFIPVLSSSFLFLSIIPKMDLIILDKAISNNIRTYFIHSSSLHVSNVVPMIRRSNMPA